jgi:uncharacterized protein (DUF952 family)
VDEPGERGAEAIGLDPGATVGRRLTYHLAPRARFEDWDAAAPYESPSLGEDGFIHCTDGVGNMVATANRFYRNEPGEFVVLTVDLGRTGSSWRIDDPGKPFPHVYGPIARDGILEVRPFPRLPDGTFLPFDEPPPGLSP